MSIDVPTQQNRSIKNMIIDYSKTKKTKHEYPQEQTDETQPLRVITTNLKRMEAPLKLHFQTHTQEKIPSLRGWAQITYILGDN